MDVGLTKHRCGKSMCKLVIELTWVYHMSDQARHDRSYIDSTMQGPVGPFWDELDSIVSWSRVGLAKRSIAVESAHESARSARQGSRSFNACLSWCKRLKGREYSLNSSPTEFIYAANTTDVTRDNTTPIIWKAGLDYGAVVQVHGCVGYFLNWVAIERSQVIAHRA